MQKETKLIVHFDGSCGPQNPGGTAAYGYIIHNEAMEIIQSASGRVGRGMAFTNNVAEFEALYQAMLYIHEHYPRALVEFNGDSTLVIAQMRGEAKAKKGKYLPYYHKTIALAEPYIQNKQWTFRWIQRALNSEADELSQYHRF